MSSIDKSRLIDFSYYAPNLLKIKILHPREDIIPFTFNSPQVKLNALFNHLLKTVGYVRVIILKARREGMSTFVEGRLFHKVHLNANTHAFIIAHDKDGVNTIFNMSKLFYDCLPNEFRPMTRYSSKKELVFENPDAKDRIIVPGLRSQIEVFSANKVTASRTGGYSCAHFSEVAFYPDGGNLIASTAPTIPDSPGTIIVYESTAFGKGGFFYEEWQRAAKKGKRKETNFFPIFFSWLEFADYCRPFADYDEKGDLLSTLDAEEKVLVQRHGAIPEQLNWRRYKLRDLQNDIDLFHQEYPTTPAEAFIASGLPYFNRTKLRELATKTSNPTFVGDITEFGLVENEDGPLMIWDKPVKGEIYTLGVDVGGGTREGDPSVIEVLRVPKDSPQIIQVAEWRDWVDPVFLAGRCVALARYYNEAMLAPEINNHGLTTLNEIKEHYWNIYRWQYFDRFAKQITNKLGWDTNVSTRPLLCDYASACLNADILVIRSEALIEEMMSFIKRPTSGGEADAGCYDDRVMAYMIGLFCLAHSFQSASILRELGTFSTPIAEEKPKEKPETWKVDTSFIPDEGKIEREGYLKGENAWLNY